MTAWKDMTPKERSAHMLAAKAAKQKDGSRLTKSTIDKALEILSPKHGVMPKAMPKKVVRPGKARPGFGVDWTQEQRDEVLRKVNSTPRTRG